jgi:hypothetical protein
MAQEKPPIIGTAAVAWEDAFRAIGAMPLVAGTAFVIVILMALTSFWIVSDPYALAASHWLPVYSIVSGIVQGLLLAPLAIAVHRYVLLGETTSRYPLDPFSARYVRFVGFAILVKILWSLPSLIQSFMWDTPEDTGATALLGLVEFVLFVVVVIVTVRRVILFPAIAVDAPGATWSNARRDTKGSSWRVAFIFVCVALPGTILGGLLYWALLSGGLGNANQLFFALLGAIVEIPMLCAFAAAASHIFRSRADTLAQPVVSPGA